MQGRRSGRCISLCREWASSGARTSPRERTSSSFHHAWAVVTSSAAVVARIIAVWGVGRGVQLEGGGGGAAAGADDTAGSG